VVAGSAIGVAFGWACSMHVCRLRRPTDTEVANRCRCVLFAALKASDAGWESFGLRRCLHAIWTHQTRYIEPMKPAEFVANRQGSTQARASSATG
jgi:hypothetical protein